MEQSKIDKLIKRRDSLLTRRDGLYDHAVVDRIDAQLAQVPPGQREDVDYALGRVLPKSAARWSTNAERAEWQAHGAEETARAAQVTQDEWLLYIADQHDDMMDFMQLCGNLAL